MSDEQDLNHHPAGRRRRLVWSGLAACLLTLIATGAIAVDHHGVFGWNKDQEGLDAASPRDGWRYVSYAGVQTQIPASWGYDAEPTSDWCVIDSLPQRPYVSFDFRGFVLGVRCDTDQPPRSTWRPHLTMAFRASKDHKRDGTTLVGDDWAILQTGLGHVTLRVQVEPSGLDLAHQILDSARLVDEDYHGCPTADPIQEADWRSPDPPWDVTEIDLVDSISVCQYAMSSDQDRARYVGMIGSTILTTQAAQDELEALQSAPLGVGPEAGRKQCTDLPPDLAEVLWLNTDHGRYPLYAYTEGCYRNGFTDGTTKRRLTPDSCRPIFATLPVFSGGGVAYDVCHSH